MPDVVITRKWRSLQSTTGILQIAPDFQCFTLEPLLPVVAGRYGANITQSPRLSQLEGRPIFTPRLYGVPGFPNDDVLIHFGNTPENTEGCCLVGLTHPSSDFIGESMMAFNEIMSLLSGHFYVTYVDAVG